MSAAVEDIGLALASELETLLTAYSVDVIRGFPNWGNVSASFPTVSLLLVGLQFPQGRVGSKLKDWIWRIILLGNEQQLWEMAEILGNWFAGIDGNAKEVSITGGNVRIAYGDSDRYQSLTGNPDEDGLMFTFATRVM